MDKNAILKAICDPTLVRRAATALKADPGPLDMVRVDTDDTLGYLAAYTGGAGAAKIPTLPYPISAPLIWGMQWQRHRR